MHLTVFCYHYSQTSLILVNLPDFGLAVAKTARRFCNTTNSSKLDWKWWSYPTFNLDLEANNSFGVSMAIFRVHRVGSGEIEFDVGYFQAVLRPGTDPVEVGRVLVIVRLQIDKLSLSHKCDFLTGN